MVVEFNLLVSRLAAILAVAKWQEEHADACRRVSYHQPDQRLMVTEAGTLRFEGRRHCVAGTMVGHMIMELCAPPTWNQIVYSAPDPVVYETSDDRLAWWETAEDGDRREYWAEQAADTLRCESGGSRSRRHG